MNYELWTMNYELWTMNYELWIMNYELYELWTMNYELWIMNYELWTMNYMNYELWIMNYELWIMNYKNWIFSRGKHVEETSIFFVTFNYLISHFTLDYDYKLIFPKLNAHRYVKIENLPDISDYTLCTWAKSTHYAGFVNYGNYATSDQTIDLDRIFIGYHNSERQFFYAWRDSNAAFHILWVHVMKPGYEIKRFIIYIIVLSNCRLPKWAACLVETCPPAYLPCLPI